MYVYVYVCALYKNGYIVAICSGPKKYLGTNALNI